MIEIGKDKPYQGYEKNFQKALVYLIRFKYPRLEFFAVPNGFRVTFQRKTTRTGSTFDSYISQKEKEANLKQAKELKAQGMKGGVSDLQIKEARHGYNGIDLELKVKGGRLSDDQKNYLASVEKRGYLPIVAYNVESVDRLLKSYLNPESDFKTDLQNLAHKKK